MRSRTLHVPLTRLPYRFEFSIGKFIGHVAGNRHVDPLDLCMVYLIPALAEGRIRERFRLRVADYGSFISAAPEDPVVGGLHLLRISDERPNRGFLGLQVDS